MFKFCPLQGFYQYGEHEIEVQVRYVETFFERFQKTKVLFLKFFTLVKEFFFVLYRK